MIKQKPIKWKKTGLGNYFKELGKKHRSLL